MCPQANSQLNDILHPWYNLTMPNEQHYPTALRHQHFVSEYIAHEFNATKAYKAVYDNDPDKPMNDQSAAASASKLLKDTKVAAMVEEAVELRVKRMAITKDKVLARYDAWANVDMSDMVNAETIIETNKEGEKFEVIRITPKPFKDLTKAQKSSISGYTIGKDGFKYALVDKKGANDMLAKHLGIDKLNVEMSGPDGGAIEIDSASTARERLRGKLISKDDESGTDEAI